MLVKHLPVTFQDSEYSIAYCHDVPENATQSILWLGGYASTMFSIKAAAIAEWAKSRSIEMIRFDYSGCGQSDGEFSDGTLSKWLNEALLIYQQIQTRPTLVIASSMGGWLALRLLEELEKLNLVMPKAALLLAPAIDFTHEILLPQLTDQLIEHINNHDKIILPYDSETITFYTKFIKDAENHRLLNRPNNLNLPMTVIHGQLDFNIPLKFTKKATKHISNMKLITITDGDHYLTRDQDIELILKKIKKLSS